MSGEDRMWGERERKAKAMADGLYRAAAAASRDPDLYGPGRVPDTVDGRFEMLALHAAAIMMRLKTQERRLSQAFAERIIQGFDESLRELGVGDMSLPRRLRRMAEALYGRLKAYEAALAPDAPETALEAALARNVWDAEAAPFAAALARRLRSLRENLAAASPQAIAERGDFARFNAA